MSAVATLPWLLTAAGADACRGFALLLDYPTAATAAACGEIAAARGANAAWVSDLAALSPVAVELVRAFAREAARLGLPEWEELYAQTFDLQPQCTLNLGHRMFGDDWKRSALLIELQNLCRRHGVDTGTELPDHLGLILRLVAALAGSAASEDADVARDLAASVLRPSVRGLRRALAAENPYTGLLQALYLPLADAAGEGAETEIGIDQHGTPLGYAGRPASARPVGDPREPPPAGIAPSPFPGVLAETLAPAEVRSLPAPAFGVPEAPAPRGGTLPAVQTARSPREEAGGRD